MTKDVSEEQFKKKVMSLNPYNFPPCSRELHQQILRTTHISSIWNNACKPISIDTSPLDLGWRMEEGSMKFKWFEGDEVLESVLEILNDESEENNEAESKEESGGENDKENEAEDEGENEGKVFKLWTKYH